MPAPSPNQSSTETRGSRLVRLLEQLRSDRSALDAHCVEIAERILPRQVASFFGQYQVEGEKRTDKILDITGAKGLERFAAVMESIITPRNSLWHRLRASDRKLMRSLRVQRYFEDVTEELFKQRYSSRANFADVQQEAWVALGAFGTGQYRIEKPREKGMRGLRYSPIHLGNIYYVLDYQGRINTGLRVFRLSAAQAVEMFDREKLPDVIVREFEKPVGTRSERPDFEFVQVVMPNSNRDTSKADHRAMAWSSEYVSVTGKMIVEEGGYRTWPFPVFRYTTAPNETYGRSPAMLALPAIKTLNEEKRIVLKQGHRAVDPITLVHDDGIMDTMDLMPGSIVSGGVNSAGQRLVHEYGNNARVDVGLELMEIERADINDVFLVTLFQVLTENPQMTATEVLERVREKGMLLAPTGGRQYGTIGQVIERELDLLAEQGLLPAMPPELVEAEGEYEVEFEGPLARMMKAEEVAGLNRALATVLPIVEVTGDPTPLLRVNMDRAMPDILWANSVPARWQNTDEEVDAIKQQLAERQTVQQAVDAAPAVAGLVKATQNKAA
jgi:hypothetical protein